MPLLIAIAYVILIYKLVEEAIAQSRLKKWDRDNKNKFK